MKVQAKVYSYLRFSDSKQAQGDSAKRQTEYAAQWAAERGLTLDANLSMKDEGLSAFHQQHVKNGALGLFLKAVEDRMVPPGSILIVESLDRLSRAEPLLAQAQLTQIINASITVVTACDNREYNRERLKAQPMDLVYSLLVMIRAHEESETKSKRVKAAIRRQCMEWGAGSYRGIIRFGHDPSWVALEDGKFKLVPDRAEALRIAIAMYQEGHGPITIVRRLSAFGIGATGKKLTTSHIYNMIRSRSLIGEKTITVDNEVYRLPGYYPAVITENTFTAIQEMFASRSRQKGKGAIPGILTGIGVSNCGYCGMTINANNHYEREHKIGTPEKKLHRRLVCNAVQNAVRCIVPGSISASIVERAVMDFCSNSINLSGLMKPSGLSEEISAQLASARQAAGDTERKLAKVTSALTDSDGEAPMVFVRKARELEKLQADQLREIEALESRLYAVSKEQNPSAASEWARIAHAAMSLDYDARMAARRLVKESFRQIQIYHRGVTPPTIDQKKRGKAMAGGEAMIVLVSRMGNTRTLIIDRKTGEWRTADAFSALPMPESVKEISPAAPPSGLRRPLHARAETPKKPALAKKATA